MRHALRFSLVCLIILAGILPFCALTVTARDSQNNLPVLSAGRIIEREMSGGETHACLIALAAGEFVRVSAEQRGIDIVLKLLAPGGQKVIEADSLNGTQGPEVAALIAALPGNYRVEVSSVSKAVPSGHYAIRIEAIRAATAEDQRWIEAQRAYVEAEQLREQGTAQSLPKSVAGYGDAIAHWQATGDRVMQAHALLSLAQAWRDLGEPKRALDYLHQALELQRSGAAQREVANTLFLIGNVNNDLGNPHQALEDYEQARREQRVLQDIYAEARTLDNMAVAWLFLGQARRALEHHTQALAVWKQINNLSGMAFTLHGIGGVYEALGEFQNSLDHYFQALAIQRRLRNRDREADELNSIGYVSSLTGEWQKALSYYTQAHQVWRAAGNRYKEAAALGNIGSAWAALDESQKALEKFGQALRLHRELGNRRFEAATLERIGELYAASADRKKALGYFEQALQICRAIEDRWNEALTLGSLGFLYVAQGDGQRAQEFFNQSLTLYRAIGDRRSEANALYGLALAARARGNLLAARQQIEAALALVEAVRASAGGQQLRAAYLASVQKYYELNIDLLMRLDQAHPAEGFAALALQASERTRARSLLELLAEARVDFREGADAALLERERDLSQQIKAAAARLTERHSPEQFAELRKEIGALEDELQQVQADIRRRSPHYAAITQPVPLSTEEIQQQLLSEDVMLLEYALGDERSYLWALTHNSVTAYELPKREQIEQTARQLYAQLTARSQRRRGETSQQWQSRVTAAETQLPETARQLSRMILAPAAAHLGNKRLLIVADGALQYVPFAMLPELSVVRGQLSVAGRSATQKQPPTADNGQRTTDNQPLIVNHEIVSLPSASMLAELRKELAVRQPAPKLLAVFADPVFSLTDERSKGRSKNVSAASRQAVTVGKARIIEHEDASQVKFAAGSLVISRLPYTRQEADQILALTPETSSLRAVDFKASRATAINGDLGQYRYLHFATHGWLDSEQPGLSALVLSLVDEQGRRQDGFLRASDIYNLKLPAELVVLSACQTGLGKEVRGEGLIGLTRGFMYAGAARVIVSLWNVNDQATADLMTKFYRKMLKGSERPASALRAAQVEMWQQRQWQSPYYWAAFVIQGEWR
ncbi:MAG TPA: CHAT domain-containing protein [Blastocatellia bacterium]|nr:CHAT domain-containing protein [Blastocatellia bacterium]